uniref:Beta-galactosidase n=1 Tax=Salix viminalis TaxID=40686 RepID=A0A6N2N6L2_SALVM
MGADSVSKLFSLGFLVVVVLLGCSQLIQCVVTYDRKAIMINGQRRILFSGSIHYPRSTPDIWEDLIKKAKDGGIDVIETYYHFEGRYDLVRFMKTIQKAGLYAHLCIGPYRVSCLTKASALEQTTSLSRILCLYSVAEGNARFSEKIVGLMKSENLYESQGGPIILSQIENEYGVQSKLFGVVGYNYMTWAADMAIQTGTGVPWVMCKEEDAPDPVINTCNGFYCDSFTPNKPYKPTIWTEAWTGWYAHCMFTEFGGPIHQRPVQDLAFAVAKFIQKGGSFVNYYMYHGGTNFGRSAGGPFVTTSYDYDAPIDEYGLIRQPKYGHLKELHRSIKMCERALVSVDPIVTQLGTYQQAHVYSTKSSDCAAFLANYDTKSSARVLFNNMHYNLPPWSISILPDCRNVVFNTAKVGVQTLQMEMLPTNGIFSWESYNEDISSLGDSSTFTTFGLLEQINVTRDASDYLWYMISVDIGSSESFLHGGELPTLIVQSTGHALHVFINGQLSGSSFGMRENRRFRYTEKVNLRPGTNRIALLSVAVGLPGVYSRSENGTVNVGGHYESWNTGWSERRSHESSLSPDSVSSVEWMQSSLAAQRPQPLTWHKAYFNAPEGDEPLALDMEGMGKGQLWINGQSIGRY